jgi:hypothetical protein
MSGEMVAASNPSYTGGSQSAALLSDPRHSRPRSLRVVLERQPAATQGAKGQPAPDVYDSVRRGWMSPPPPSDVTRARQRLESGFNT